LDSFLANNNAGAAIDIRGTGGNIHGVTVVGNTVYASNIATEPLYFENVSNATVNGNTGIDQVSVPANFIQFNTGGDWLTAIGNNSGGATTPVSNLTGAAHAQIINNQ
jgi:hypothetical protein